MDIDKHDLHDFYDMKELVRSEVKEALIEQYINKTDLPPIDIKPEEVKDRMLTILSEKAIKNMSG
jgi:hypothetical protein